MVAGILPDKTSFAISRRRLSVLVGMLGLAVLSLLWGGIAYHLEQRERDAFAQAHNDVANLSFAVRENVERTLAGIDQVLRFVAADHDADPTAFDFSRWLERADNLPDIVMQLGKADAGGDFAQSSSPLPSRRVSIADRTYFRIHAEQANAGTFVATVTETRLGRRSGFQMSRRLRLADGSFAGVVFATLDPSRMAAGFAALDVGPQGSVTLVGRDGFIRARSPEFRGMYELDLRATDPGRQLFAHLEAVGDGTLRVARAVDGTERIFGQRAARSLPMVVAVSKSAAEVLAPVLAERRRLVGIGAVVSLLIAGLFATLLGELERRRRIERALVDAHRDLAAAVAATRAGWDEARRLNQHLLTAEKVAQYGYWRLALPGMELTWSPETFRIYGRSPAAGVPGVEGAIAAYHPADRATVQACVEAAIQHGRAFEFRARVVAPDGEVRAVVARGRVERAASGGVTAVFGTILDVSGTKRASEALSSSSVDATSDTPTREAAPRRETVTAAAEDR